MAWCIAAQLIAVIALSGESGAAPAPPADKAAARSAGFWNDWTELRQSESWQALQSKVGLTEKSRSVAAEAAQANQQGVVSVSLDSPRDTAKFLTSAAQAGGGLGIEGAVATALRMRASPQMVSAAAPLVAPEQRAEVQSFRANLSTGIPGLPGIYLGDQTISRSPAPAGYAPVSGGSLGCGH